MRKLLNSSFSIKPSKMIKVSRHMVHEPGLKVSPGTRLREKGTGFKAQALFC
jgi:hypothetical protein